VNQEKINNDQRILSGDRSENSVLWKNSLEMTLSKSRTQINAMSKWSSNTKTLKDKCTNDIDDNDQERKPYVLPPLVLPPIYLTKTTPVKTKSEKVTDKGHVSQKDWEELKKCRYLRPALSRYRFPESEKDYTNIESE
jgi:hypothetical protein